MPEIARVAEYPSSLSPNPHHSRTLPRRFGCALGHVRDAPPSPRLLCSARQVTGNIKLYKDIPRCVAPSYSICMLLRPRSTRAETASAHGTRSRPQPGLAKFLRTAQNIPYAVPCYPETRSPCRGPLRVLPLGVGWAHLDIACPFHDSRILTRKDGDA